MKDCNTCRYCYDAGGECAYYVCQLFGGELELVGFAKGDGCCLHQAEVQKAVRLLERHQSWAYSVYGNDVITDHQRQMIEKTAREYNEYFNHLKQKYGVTDDEH